MATLVSDSVPICLSSEQCLALRTGIQQLRLISLIRWHVAAGQVLSGGRTCHAKVSGQWLSLGFY